MFKTLRGRLILSHILPFLIIIPLIGAALVYFLETQFLLPQLSVDLSVDARVLAQMARYEPDLFQNPQLAQAMLQSYGQSSDAKLTLLNSDGDPLTDPQSGGSGGYQLGQPDLQQIQAGQVITHINPQILPPVSSIEVLAPVITANNQMLGIVRLTYSFESVLTRLMRLRTWIIVIAMLGLALGVILGWFLAITISRPIQQATGAVNRVAQGHFDERLPVNDPLEIRQLAEAVNYLVDRLQNLEQARQKLLANLVHELGRPLGALRSATQALSKGASQDPQLMSDLLAGMDEETIRLQHLLDDLNGLYDQALGGLELDWKELALIEWLPQVLSPWQEAAQAKGLDWQTKIEEDLPSIQADPLRLGQALGNLASNAIKFTPSGGWVSFRAGQQDGEIQLIFQDNGPGIVPEDQEKIFHPFYQGETGKRMKQGMGLGLSIARELTTAHGGQLEVESEPGKGSTFTIRLRIEHGS